MSPDVLGSNPGNWGIWHEKKLTNLMPPEAANARLATPDRESEDGENRRIGVRTYPCCWFSSQ